MNRQELVDEVENLKMELRMSRACSAEILDVLKAHRFVFERRIEGDKEVMDALECFQPAMYKLITADLKTARSEPKVS